MRHARERGLLAGILLGGPLLVYLVAIRPQQAQLRVFRARIAAADAQYTAPATFEPLRPWERAFLEDPAAPWRRRLPLLQEDVSRVAHYHGVVSAWHQASDRHGVSLKNLRSSWDPVKGAFSLPPRLAEVAFAPTAPDRPESTLNGWVLEAEVAGGTDRLFGALVAALDTPPLLEPVGLRWRQVPGEARRQHLLVRNLVLLP